MIKDLKILACDIDGTLCMKGGDLMPLTREAIIALHNEGVLFGPASGRPMGRTVLSRAEEWKLGFPFDFAIGMNGGELYRKDTNKIEKYHLLSPEHIKKILTFLKPFDVNVIVYVNGYEEIRAFKLDALMQNSQKRNHSHVTIGDIDYLAEFPTSKIEVCLYEKDRDAILEVVKNNPDPAWHMVQTYRCDGYCTFEFQDPRVDKGNALLNFAESLGIAKENIMTFGDQDNDLGLIKDAGWGVCLKNGCEACKEVADAVTEHDVYDDGVGHYLQDHWFNK